MTEVAQMEVCLDRGCDAQPIQSDLDPCDLFLPNSPWDFSDSLGLDALPERPRDAVFSEEQEDDVYVPEVTEEDYDGPERIIYVLLRDRLRTACNVNTIWTKRIKAAEWVFQSNLEDAKGITFRLACQALGARVIVLQTRLHYQLYKAGVPYQEALPLMVDRLPETVSMEVLYHTGDNGVDLAKQVWQWPGIRADVLRDRMSYLTDAEFGMVIQRLEGSGHLGLKHGFWFLISRNPELFALEGRRRFVWSRSFLGDK